MEKLVRALQERASGLAKPARRSGLAKVSVDPWMSLDLLQAQVNLGAIDLMDVIRELLDTLKDLSMPDWFVARSPRTTGSRDAGRRVRVEGAPPPEARPGTMTARSASVQRLRVRPSVPTRAP